MRIYIINLLRKKISKIVTKIGGLHIFIAKHIYTNPHSIRVKQFKNTTNPLILTTFKNIDNTSIVFDIGGYMGQWSSDLFARYQPNIYIFEPVNKYFNIIKNRFSNNNKIHIYNFGFDNKNKKLKIFISNDASSIYKKAETTEIIYLKKISKFIKKEKIKKIDLIKINIEGGEYGLLEDLIFSKKIKYIHQILIQFHEFVENADQKMQIIQNQLSKTHKPVYQYKYVWEHWILK